MANDTNITSRKPRRWLRWIGFIFGGVIVLLVAAYFIGTSGWFLKSVILPKASQSLNVQIAVDSSDISPFSAVTLRGLRVQTTGTEPLVTAQEVRARYKLMDIIKGNINVDEVALQSPVVNLITFADGTSNLDPLTKTKKEKPGAKEPKEKKAEKPPQLDLTKFALNNATVRQITERKDGTRQVIELTGVNVTADNLANGKTAKLALAADLRFDQGLKSATNGVLAAKVNGKFDVALDPTLKPSSVTGQAQVDATEAKGAFQQAAGLGVVLNAALTPTELKDASVRFTQRGNALGALAVSGPFNAETMEGKLAIRISQIDRQLLNVAGAAMGIDFDRTTINSSNMVELTQKGRVISVNGQLAVGSFSITQKGQTTPPLDVRSIYAVTYDQTNRTALIQAFTLNGVQQGAEFLRGALAKPMLLDLSKGSNAVDESSFDLVVTNLNLADWRAFAGTNVNLASGRLGLTLSVVSRQAGQNLTLNLATRIAGLTGAAGSNRIDNADIALSARGTVQDFSRVKLDNYRAELARGGQQALTASGALQYDTKSQDADVQANLDVSLPQVASLVMMPGLSVNSGTVKFAGRVVQKNSAPELNVQRASASPKSGTANVTLDRTIAGKLNLDNFTGAFGSNRFDRFETVVDLDVAMRGSALDIRKCSGALKQSGQAGGAFDLAGKYDLTSKAGQITAKISDLNQNVIKSFTAAALGEKQLQSVTIGANTTARLEQNGASDVKAELHVANLVVNDPEGKLPKTPLAVDAALDAAMAKQVLDLRRAQIALTKTERAANQLNFSGRIDMSKSNSYSGNLKITSDGLDVTPYYDLFAGNKQTNATSNSTAQPTAAGSPKPQTEPAPVQLPFAQFTEELNVAKFYLREIEISNFVSKTTIDNGRVTVNPFALVLNGAPVSLQAIANLAVPGYEYDVKLNGNGIPVEPLVNTFAPEKRGQLKGFVLAGAQIKGAGLTGSNLKKNLQGQIGLTLTNAMIQITLNKWIQRILAPISFALRFPDIAKSPLTLVDVHASVRDGTINIANTTVESTAFKANVPGTITMANEFTNSTLNHLPVQLVLKRAPKAGATNAELITLPQFVSVAGTVGKPEPKIDAVAVGGILASSVGNIVGGDVGKILQNLGNLGAVGTNQTRTGTNAASTNAVGNLIQGLGGLFQKQPTKTNTATTNAPPKNKFNLNDLLK